MFLKSILDEDRNSRIFKFFKLQLEKPTKGDWVSQCKKDLSELNIRENFEEITNMQKVTFLNIIKEKLKENALKYLNKKKGSKGKEIEYNGLEMAEYFMPYGDELTIEDKQYIFSIRNRMVDIGANYGKSESCFCGADENMLHVYTCKHLNVEETNVPYENIHTGNLREIVEVFRRFEENMRIREKIKTNKNKVNKPPCDQYDPLNCAQYSIG